MKLSGKIVAFGGCAVVVLAVALAWHFARARAEEHRFTREAEAYRVRAERGDAEAQYYLAGLYRRGKGVSQNYAEALHWYQKAADQDNAKAEYALGYMYHYGEGVPRDEAQAVGWCRKAAERGESEAEYVLGRSYYYGEGVPQDRALAVQWCRRAADHGSAHGQYLLGYMYYYGQGVERDRIAARRLFREAASRGDKDAQRALGLGRVSFAKPNRVALAVIILGSLLFLIGSLRPGQGSRDQHRLMALAGLLGLLSAGLDFSLDFSTFVFRFPLAVSTFYFVRQLVGGMLTTLLLSIVYSRSIKFVSTASSTLLIAFNFFAITHWDLRSLPPVSIFLSHKRIPDRAVNFLTDSPLARLQGGVPECGPGAEVRTLSIAPDQ